MIVKIRKLIAYTNIKLFTELQVCTDYFMQILFKIPEWDTMWQMKTPTRLSTRCSLKVKIKLYYFIFINVNVCLLQRKNKMVYTTYVNISFDKRKIHLTWHWQEVYENHRRRNFANVKSYSGLLNATLTCTKKCHSQSTMWNMLIRQRTSDETK